MEENVSGCFFSEHSPISQKWLEIDAQFPGNTNETPTGNGI